MVADTTAEAMAGRAVVTTGPIMVAGVIIIIIIENKGSGHGNDGSYPRNRMLSNAVPIGPKSAEPGFSFREGMKSACGSNPLI